MSSLRYPYLNMQAGALVGVFGMIAGCSTPPPAAPPTRDSGVRDVGNVLDAPVVDTGPAPTDVGGDVTERGCDLSGFQMALDPVTRPRSVVVSRDNDVDLVFAWSGGAAGEQVDIANLAAVSDMPAFSSIIEDNIVRQPASSDSVLTWVEISGDESIVFVAHPPSAAIQVSESGRHDGPQIIQVEGGWWLAWTQLNAERGWDIRYRFFDGESLGELMSLDVSASESKIAIAESEGVMAVAWIAEGNAFTQSLMPSGAAVGEATVVSTDSNVTSGITLALDGLGGLVAFVVDVGGQSQVRSRILDLEAAPRRNEQIVSVPNAGTDPSVATYAGGFAIVYRARSPGGQFSVELAFVHGSTGSVVDRYVVDSSDWSDGRPGIAITTVGTLGIGWAEQMPEGTQIRAARIQCEEAWLRCSR